ncbi:collectin-12-like [Mytilus californianus]|uniref:collectin-12-like n=1 Tax=Mytilus californianus TaxID=6549 RepID=UPI0022466FCD|nr:collectin-12-like [Mytilus californianus]
MTKEDTMLTFVALFVVFLSGVSALGCEKYWVQFENSCYFSNQLPESERKAFDRIRSNSADMVEDVWFKYPQAKAACERKDAHLVEIETKAENDFVKKLAQKVPNHSVWLGGTDAAKEGTWVWSSSGKPFTFKDWWKSIDGRRGDEPDDYGKHGQDCLSLSKYDNYKAWYDSDCSDKHRRGDFKGIICEKPAE